MIIINTTNYYQHMLKAIRQLPLLTRIAKLNLSSFCTQEVKEAAIVNPVLAKQKIRSLKSLIE